MGHLLNYKNFIVRLKCYLVELLFGGEPVQWSLESRSLKLHSLGSQWNIWVNLSPTFIYKKNGGYLEIQIHLQTVHTDTQSLLKK